MCITEDTVAEIVHQEIKPLEKDVVSIRRLLIGGLVAILTGGFGIGVWVGTVQNDVSHIQVDADKFEVRIEDRLIRIEQMLIEITRNKSQ